MVLQKIKKAAALILCAAVTACFFGCTVNDISKYKRTEVRYDYFDTVTVITAYEEDEEAFEAVCEKVFGLFEEYNRLYDIYHTYSGTANLRTVNRNAGKEPVKVDRKIIDLLLLGKEMYTLTDGCVNIAMGAVLGIWHNHREDAAFDPYSASLPAKEELEAAAAHCDINKVIIDESENTVFLTDPDMSLDVGAIGKGLATEAAAALLISLGAEGYTLNVGGSVRVTGAKPDGKSWTAGIENPDRNSDSAYSAVIEMTDGALVTSGSYQRYYTVDGVRYHHIIDPATLFPRNEYTSVSIYGENTAVADALSTALFNMTREDGERLIDSLNGYSAMWIYPDGTVEVSSGFPKDIQK